MFYNMKIFLKKYVRNSEKSINFALFKGTNKNKY